MATTAPLKSMLQNFESFIGSCTPGQISQLNEAIKAVQTHTAETATNKATPSMTVKAGVAASKKKQKKQSGKKPTLQNVTTSQSVVVMPPGGVTASAGPKRPLNSFMAYRKFYCVVLPGTTQKAASKLVTIWWHADPFSAKWTILAKVYSILRGSRSKDEVPLDAFFKICAPAIGVIPPGEYLQMMGWQLGPPNPDDPDKVPQLTRVFVPEDFPDFYNTTSLSVTDLVNLCHKAGFPKVPDANASNTTMTGSITMAVQPTTSAVTHIEDVCEAVNNQLSDATVALHNTGAGYPYNTEFDPTAQVDFTFDPVAEHTHAWDAYDPNMVSTHADLDGVDWCTFLNEGNVV